MRYVEEFSGLATVKTPVIRKRDNKLYDVEVTEVDKVNKTVKLHFVGFGSQFDEWRPFGGDGVGEYFPFLRTERLLAPVEQSVGDREQIFLGLLYREIKKKLWSGRREDPEVNIDLNVDHDVFMKGLGTVKPSIMERGRMVFPLKSNRDLDVFLGQTWDERILNCNGDFAYVIEGTVKYWLGQRSPITEYKLIGGQYIKSEIENCYFIAFQFVRGDGNRHTYNNRK